MVLLELFWAFFQVTLFSIGGGYAALPMIKNVAVDRYGWLTMAQFTDLIVIDEMAPGPVILNSATFVGAQTAGFPGAVMATVGCLTSPAIIISIIAYFYFKYQNLSVVKAIISMLRPAVVALIASAALSVLILTFWGESGFSTNIRQINFIGVAIFAVALVTLRKWKPNPTLVILGCGAIGGIIYSFL